MLNWERITVHRVGEQCVGVTRVFEREAPLEEDAFRRPFNASVVGAAENDLAGGGLQPGAVQHFDERHTGPLGGAHRTELPLLTFHGWVKASAAVACALERRDERVRHHVLQVTQAELQRVVDQATHLKPPDARLEPRGLEVVANVEARIGHHHATDEGGDRRLTVPRVLFVNDKTSRLRIDDDRQTRSCPRTHPAREVDRVETRGEKGLGHRRGAPAGPAHHDDASITGQVLLVPAHLPHRQQRGAGRMSRIPLVGLSHVEEQRTSINERFRSAGADLRRGPHLGPSAGTTPPATRRRPTRRSRREDRRHRRSQHRAARWLRLGSDTRWRSRRLPGARDRAHQESR